MAKIIFALFVSALLFLCLCIEDNPPSENNITSTTALVNETTTVSIEITTSSEASTTTTDEIPPTTIEWVIDTTTLPDTTTTVITPTTAYTKQENGLSCNYNSDCLSDNCVGEMCCNKGQCGFDGKCYNFGDKRRDGKVCNAEVWKKVLGWRCVNDSECITNYCIDGFCCNKGQCAFGMGAACYSAGQVRYDLTMTCAGDSIWKKSLGQRCEVDIECINGLCNKYYCCPATQCPYKSACYKVGEITADGVYKCMGDYSMKKRAGHSCGNSTECSTNYCVDGYCCESGQCWYSGKCYDPGDETQEGVCQSGIWRKD